MTKTKLFAATAVLASMIATPVLAQGLSEQSKNTGIAKYKKMQNPNMRASDHHVYRDRSADMRFDRGYDDRGYRADTGFFPLNVATGIVGGAVGTAGAIASAPFGGWNNGYANAGWNNTGYNQFGYNDGYGRNYRNSNASINDYPRVGSFASQPYTNPYELNRVGRAAPFAGQSFAKLNGFVCVPGTVFTNVNGIRTICQ